MSFAVDLYFRHPCDEDSVQFHSQTVSVGLKYLFRRDSTKVYIFNKQ